MFFSTCTAVDNEPQTCVPSYQVLKMRVSLLSSAPSVSPGDGPNPERQVTARQSRSGSLASFCSDAGGTTYVSDGTTERSSVNARWVLSSDRVFDSVQNPMVFDRPSGLPVSCAAVVLRKYSLPPFASANTPSGELAGITVNPGIGDEPSVSARFSNCTTRTVAAPDVNAAREKA